jgi:hypothetical protein
LRIAARNLTPGAATKTKIGEKIMKIEYGKIVEDKEGNKVGQVNHVIRDSWTGEVKKFGIWNPDRDKDVLVSPDNIKTVTDNKIVLEQNPDEIS